MSKHEGLAKTPFEFEGREERGGSDPSFPVGGHTHRGLENIAIHKGKIFGEFEVLQCSGFWLRVFSCRDLILLKSYVAIVWDDSKLTTDSIIDDKIVARCGEFLQDAASLRWVGQ